MINMTGLEKAKMNESEKILGFYRDVIDTTGESEFKTRWSERYPNLEYVKTAIENGEMVICKKDDEIIACVVLNNRFDPEYENVNWNIDANPDEIIIIHAFAILTRFAGKGIGKKVFEEIKADAIRNNKKTIRIDIIDGNTGALKVFEKLGFEYADSREITHQAVGLETFHLYEYDLNEK